MEGMSPSLRLALSLKFSLESGESARQALKSYLSLHNDELSSVLAAWLCRKEQGKTCFDIIARIKSPYQKSLIDCLDRGLRGESILNQISMLELEIIEACNDEIEKFASLLPLKALAPLLLLQFPALFILFLAPMLSQLTQSF